MGVGFPLVVVMALTLAVLFIWHRDRSSRARFLRRAGFILMALITFFFGAFIVGETFTDPGGWEAAGLVALWVVPLDRGGPRCLVPTGPGGPDLQRPDRAR